MIAQPPDTMTPELAERVRAWSAYMARLDASYEEAALMLGAPYIRHSTDEMEEIAALVADFGIDPEAMLPAEPIDERELTIAGVG